MENIRAIVLAAGKGVRLGSEQSGLPKVMRRINGRPMLSYVLDSIGLPPESVVVVVGYMKEKVIDAFPGYGYAIQTEQRGTGDAVRSAESFFDGYTGNVLVCYGDMPLISSDSYSELIKTHISDNAVATLLVGTYPEQMPYGRIIRDTNGGFHSIIEAKDSDSATDLIREYNAGVYVFNAAALFTALRYVTADNNQGEYYLTDAPGIIRESGGKVSILAKPLGEQLVGVSTESDILRIERILNDAR